VHESFVKAGEGLNTVTELTFGRKSNNTGREGKDNSAVLHVDGLEWGQGQW
jgi:hypothetical protein